MSAQQTCHENDRSPTALDCPRPDLCGRRRAAARAQVIVNPARCSARTRPTTMKSGPVPAPRACGAARMPEQTGARWAPLRSLGLNSLSSRCRRLLAGHRPQSGRPVVAALADGRIVTGRTFGGYTGDPDSLHTQIRALDGYLDARREGQKKFCNRIFDLVLDRGDGPSSGPRRPGNKFQGGWRTKRFARARERVVCRRAGPERRNPAEDITGAA